MWTGKILGFLIGLAIAGPLGALVGLFFGHLFDKGRANVHRRFDPAQRARVEQTFFNTLFSLLGHVAKADGRISESEISGTEQLMERMGLRPEDRRRAIGLFKQGATPNYDIDPVLAAFNHECGSYANLKQMLLIYLISLALADGGIDEAEKRVLQQVAARLGYSAAVFNRILRMAIAQTRFYRYEQPGADGQQSSQARADELATAYEALGVDKTVSDNELKRTYRRLMSQYHPDKVAGRGVPQDMMELATERAQEIQAAYDLIRKDRGIR